MCVRDEALYKFTFTFNYLYSSSYSKLKSHCTQLVLTIRRVTVVVSTIACRAATRLCAQFVKRQAAEQRWLRQSVTQRRQCHNNNWIFGSRSRCSLPINSRSEHCGDVRVWSIAFVCVTPLYFPTHLSHRSVKLVFSPLLCPQIHVLRTLNAARSTISRDCYTRLLIIYLSTACVEFLRCHLFTQHGPVFAAFSVPLEALEEDCTRSRKQKDKHRRNTQW